MQTFTFNGHDYRFKKSNFLIKLYDINGSLLAQCEHYLEYYHAIFYNQEGQHMDIFDCQQHENNFNNDMDVAKWLAASHPET
jgi:hypothetical protein